MKTWKETLVTFYQRLLKYPVVVRWSAAVVVLIVLVGLVFGQYLDVAEKITLFDGRQLTTDEIGSMQVAFGQSGLNEYDIQGSRVLVPRAQRGDYLKALADHGAVPRDLSSTHNNQSTFDLFQTRAQHRAQQLERKKQTIREMVMQLRFVDRAIVDYDEAAGATPFDGLQRTAVVNVTPALDRALTETDVKAIRDTVRGAVAGLKTSDITIIDTYASKSHSAFHEDEMDSALSSTITKLQVEQKYENKIRSALKAYPGIRVNVEVGIDPVIRRVRDERRIEGDPVVVQKTLQKETSARLPSTSPSILRAVFGQGANSQASVEDQKQPYQRTVERTETMANGLFETTESAGPVVTHVNVSIGIPERCVDYFVEKEIKQAASPKELKDRQQAVFFQLRSDIREKITPLIPAASNEKGTGHADQVVVTLDRQISISDAETDSNLTAKSLPAKSSGSLLPWVGIVGASCLCLMVWRFWPEKNVSIAYRKSPAGVADQLVKSRDGNRAAARRESNRTDSITHRPGSLPRNGVRVVSPKDAPAVQDRSVAKVRVQMDRWCRENPKTAAATIRQWLDRKVEA